MPSARRAEASTSEADDSMHLGLLFVALFGVYNCDLQKVKDEGAKLCFCVSDAVQFVQQKWHCAEIAIMLGWAASLFHTASACLLLMDITTGDIPRMALPDMYIPCDEKEPLDCESWLAQSCAGRINWKEKLKQLVTAFEFLEELSSDEHLDAMWRKKLEHQDDHPGCGLPHGRASELDDCTWRDALRHYHVQRDFNSIVI